MTRSPKWCLPFRLKFYKHFLSCPCETHELPISNYKAPAFCDFAVLTKYFPRLSFPFRRQRERPSFIPIQKETVLLFACMAYIYVYIYIYIGAITHSKSWSFSRILLTDFRSLSLNLVKLLERNLQHLIRSYFLRWCRMYPIKFHLLKIRSTPSSLMGSKAGRSHVVRYYGT
jgi:hypothetical protein